MNTILELKDVSHGFGAGPDRSEILAGINLSITEGELVAVVGYSGSGKTTLISIMAGLLNPERGEVHLKGQPVTGPGPDRALVFQNYSLLPWLTVYGNVALAVNQVFGSWPLEKRREHILKHIEMVNLGPAQNKRPAELSGGMRQRVAVARGLALDPEILFLDEPLSALDALSRATLQDEIAGILERDKKTVILVTNDVDEGILLADRIIPLSSGPEATLGPEVMVDLPRPRDRKQLNQSRRYREIRRAVLDYLLGEGKGKETVSLSHELILPDIEPEDLGSPRLLGGRRTPLRKREVKREEIQVNL